MSRPIPKGVRVCTKHGPGFHPYCPACAIDSGRLPIAAPADSEVARLNTNPTQISTSLVDPKDALIRELVSVLSEVKEKKAKRWHPLDSTLKRIESTLTLARTTFPEAFE